MENHNQQDYESFEQYYNCFPVLIKDKGSLEYGNRIIMPPSALERLANMDIDYPMVFEIKKPTTTTTATGASAAMMKGALNMFLIVGFWSLVRMRVSFTCRNG